MLILVDKGTDLTFGEGTSQALRHQRLAKQAGW